jgi:ribonuclease HII
MRISFMVDAEESHMPVALASMVSKYTRELLMDRLNAYFIRRIPGLKPTAGYAQDGKRFLEDLNPHLADLGIDPGTLRRHA